MFAEALANDVKLLARGFALCVFLHGIELPGDICHHRVDIISGSDPRGGEKAFRQPLEIRLCEHDRRGGVDDVSVEISP